MIYLIATLEIKPGSLPDIMAAVTPCIAATRKEAGCISYDLVHSLTGENCLMFIERWKDKAALDAHFQEPHLIAWRKAGEPFFLGRKLEIIEPADIEVR